MFFLIAIVAAELLFSYVLLKLIFKIDFEGVFASIVL